MDKPAQTWVQPPLPETLQPRRLLRTKTPTSPTEPYPLGARAVADALMRFRDKSGHFPNCGHRIWVNGYDNQPGHGHVAGVDCPDQQCKGEGAPCSDKCSAANRALGFVPPIVKPKRRGSHA